MYLVLDDVLEDRYLCNNKKKILKLFDKFISCAFTVEARYCCHFVSKDWTCLRNQIIECFIFSAGKWNTFKGFSWLIFCIVKNATSFVSWDLLNLFKQIRWNYFLGSKCSAKKWFSFFLTLFASLPLMLYGKRGVREGFGLNRYKWDWPTKIFQQM